jgi:hypothetical protein
MSLKYDGIVIFVPLPDPISPPPPPLLTTFSLTFYSQSFTATSSLFLTVIVFSFIIGSIGIPVKKVIIVSDDMNDIASEVRTPTHRTLH